MKPAGSMQWFSIQPSCAKWTETDTPEKVITVSDNQPMAYSEETKGANGLPFKMNSYFVRDTDTVTPKFRKDGSLKSVKVKINRKDYKAKKG